MPSKLHKHEKLGISFVEFGALLAVRELIRGGYVHHVRKVDAFVWGNVWEQVLRKQPSGCHLINMSVTEASAECSSVGCIGGTMAMIMGKDDPDLYVKRSGGEMRKLFYPPQDGVYKNEPEYDDITPKQMLAAIDNFIARGKASWPAVLGLRKRRH